MTLFWLVVWNIFFFSIIYGIILPIDEYFSRWLNHQPGINLRAPELCLKTDPMDNIMFLANSHGLYWLIFFMKSPRTNPQEHIPRPQSVLRMDLSHYWISRVVALGAGGRGVEKIREFPRGNGPLNI